MSENACEHLKEPDALAVLPMKIDGMCIYCWKQRSEDGDKQFRRQRTELLNVYEAKKKAEAEFEKWKKYHKESVHSGNNLENLRLGVEAQNRLLIEALKSIRDLCQVTGISSEAYQFEVTERAQKALAAVQDHLHQSH